MTHSWPSCRRGAGPPGTSSACRSGLPRKYCCSSPGRSQHFQRASDYRTICSPTRKAFRLIILENVAKSLILFWTYNSGRRGSSEYLSGQSGDLLFLRNFEEGITRGSLIKNVGCLTLQHDKSKTNFLPLLLKLSCEINKWIINSWLPRRQYELGLALGTI